MPSNLLASTGTLNVFTSMTVTMNVLLSGAQLFVAPEIVTVGVVPRAKPCAGDVSTVGLVLVAAVIETGAPTGVTVSTAAPFGKAVVFATTCSFDLLRT